METREKLEVIVEVRINYPDEASAESILKAISPDNYSAPPGIEIRSEVSGTEVKLSITSVKGLGSLISTIDDLLSCMQIAEKAVKGIN